MLCWYVGRQVNVPKCCWYSVVPGPTWNTHRVILELSVLAKSGESSHVHLGSHTKYENTAMVGTVPCVCHQ